MKESLLKVALITNMVTPYRIPVWKALSSFDIDLNILTLVESEPNRNWNKDYHGSKVKSLRGFRKYMPFFEAGVYIAPNLFLEKEFTRSSIVILTGYENPTYLAALIYCKMTGKPIVLWWGSHEKSSKIKNRFFLKLKKKILDQFDGYVTYGRKSTQYLINIGIDKKEISTGVNTVDVEKFRRLDSMFVRSGNVRKFLFVGQLIDRKGIQDLIDVFAEYGRPDQTLSIVGDGELINYVKIACKNTHNIRYLGSVNTVEEMAAIYWDHDALFIPSKAEVWGLVANEAIAAGLYVVVSNNSGSADDLKALFPNRVIVFDIERRDGLISALMEVSSRNILQFNADIDLISPSVYAEAIAKSIFETAKRRQR
ncbi:glycosyl transferase family 1 [Deinococcus indicus]|uniref:glycosyltransferase n=1 Tax=Deinococcus indicus TaxID=223556 RepID=UPI00174D548B|nr:glycosyltransferase [Deinococcus indicus]GHG27636.1 glycosyl transferase family 1 [Deinococcus indicus]